jgi:hypothetical protein
MLLLFISPQSSSCSVPLTEFVDIYHNLVPRCYRGLRWSVYDLAKSHPNFRGIFWFHVSWRRSRTIVIISRCSAIFETPIPVVSLCLAKTVVTKSLHQHLVRFCSGFPKFKTKLTDNMTILV